MKGNLSLEKGSPTKHDVFLIKKKIGRIGQIEEEEGGEKMKGKGGMKGEGEERRQSWKEGRGERKR
jgi:hypothetical protein